MPAKRTPTERPLGFVRGFQYGPAIDLMLPIGHGRKPTIEVQQPAAGLPLRLATVVRPLVVRERGMERIGDLALGVQAPLDGVAEQELDFLDVDDKARGAKILARATAAIRGISEAARFRCAGCRRGGTHRIVAHHHPFAFWARAILLLSASLARGVQESSPRRARGLSLPAFTNQAPAVAISTRQRSSTR